MWKFHFNCQFEYIKRHLGCVSNIDSFILERLWTTTNIVKNVKTWEMHEYCILVEDDKFELLWNKILGYNFVAFMFQYSIKSQFLR